MQRSGETVDRGDAGEVSSWRASLRPTKLTVFLKAVRALK
jgi:hypothetical protein